MLRKLNTYKDEELGKGTLWLSKGWNRRCKEGSVMGQALKDRKGEEEMACRMY